MQVVKHYDNQRKVPNAASITTDNWIKYWLFNLSPTYLQRSQAMRAMSDRKIQTNNVKQVKPFASKLNGMKVSFIDSGYFP